MMEDSDYCKEALLKINKYNKFGYMPGKNLITTFESSNCPLNTRNIVRQINEYLK